MCYGYFPKKERPAVIISKKSKKEVVKLWENMTVRDLASVLHKDIDSTFQILSYIKEGGIYDNASAKIGSSDVLKKAGKIAGKRPIIIKNPSLSRVVIKNDKDAYKRPPAPPSAMVSRPPVLTIMGHVDHGKTTLLDRLRNSKIVDTEFGGITQHIGAFQFHLPDGPSVTVLDTPGHAAFSSMRGRGAHVTDIAVLVVAADDGVMPQTQECIEHADDAGVPIVVAINKIDKFDADVARTRRSLLQAGVQLEDDGGDVQAVEISAKQGTNVPVLIESVVTLAEMLDLKADPKGLVEASVLEAKTVPIKGKVATCLIQRGTLRPGAFLVAGRAWAKVRAMHDDMGANVTKASPAAPVQVTGWKELPEAGDEVLEVPSQRRAKEVVNWRQAQLEAIKTKQDLVIIEAKQEAHNAKHKQQLTKKHKLGYRYKMRIANFTRTKETDETDTGPHVAIVLKCDVQGSHEAIMQVLDTYDSAHVKLSLLNSGVGPITASDVEMANLFKGTVFAFNVEMEFGTRDLASSLRVPVVNSNIIYRLIEQLRTKISEQMPSLPKEEELGEADVLEEFLVGEGKKKKVPVAGCRCTKGALLRKERFRLVRDGEVVHEGLLASMRHVKNEVETIGDEKECGIKFEDASVRFVRGDRIVCYTVKQLPQECDWHPPGF